MVGGGRLSGGLACVRVRGCVRVPAGVRVRRCACAIVDPVGTASSV